MGGGRTSGQWQLNCLFRVSGPQRPRLPQHQRADDATFLFFVWSVTMSVERNELNPLQLCFLQTLLSPSGDLGIGLVWDNNWAPGPHFGPTVEILFQLNQIIYDGSSVVLRKISDDFRCFPMFSAVFLCSRLFSYVLSCFMMFLAGL